MNRFTSLLLGKPSVDSSIIVRTYAECTLCEHLAVLNVGFSTLLLQDVEKHAVLSLARNDNHVLEVLGTGTDQGDTADINLDRKSVV